MADNAELTKAFYDTNADTYVRQTRNTDMSASYEMFLKYVPDDGRILDVGCGSGRDLRYFRENGYAVEGLELSGNLAALAREYSGCTVYEGDIRNWTPAEIGCYDAIWACASLLHLTREEVFAFFEKLPKFLRPNGVIFCSMKVREESGYDDKGRFFCEFSKEDVANMLDKIPELVLLECRETKDGLGRDDTNWISFMFKRQ